MRKLRFWDVKWLTQRNRDSEWRQSQILLCLFRALPLLGFFFTLVSHDESVWTWNLLENPWSIFKYEVTKYLVFWSVFYNDTFSLNVCCYFFDSGDDTFQPQLPTELSKKFRKGTINYEKVRIRRPKLKLQFYSL